MAKPLEGEALKAFLSHGNRTAKVAIARKDGSCTVSPVWFVMDGDDLVFNTMSTSLKGRVLRRDPRIALCVEDGEFPYGFASIEGEAVLEQLAPEELLPWATKIAARYVPAEQAEAFGRRNAVDGELLVRVRPKKVFAFSGVAD